MNCGIIGFPNVGKTALYNLLTGNNAASSNYPYCTVEPNTGIALLKDCRINKLGEVITGSKVTYPGIKLVDVAGLPPGASKGEGLGNQFLSTIRSSDTLIHVVRAFNSSSVSRFDKNVSSPMEDLELLQTELFLSDIEIVKRRIKENPYDSYWKDILVLLEEGTSPEADVDGVLLTPKSQLVIINISTGMEKPEIKRDKVIYIDIAFQQELLQMEQEE
ncbi:GTPase, partial [Elusimicrobiota bacterium]